MNGMTIFPSYIIGENPLENLKEITEKLGKRIVVIGGETALRIIKSKLIDIDIIDFIWYGGDCTYTNINKIAKDIKGKNIDLVIGVGGGKAIDTAKAVADKVGGAIITIPTIASTCAAITSLSVVYTDDGDFDEFYFYNKPPSYSLIDSSIIAKAPIKYLRAGIGDTLAKHYECTLASRGDKLNHSSAMAREISKMCVEPLLQYGEKALSDANNGVNSFELEQVILNNIVSTGLVSMLIDEKYNGAVAHSIFYGLTLLEHIEKDYLHGDVVAYGVLVQLAIDNNIEEATKLNRFFNKIGIPTNLDNIQVRNEREYLEPVLKSIVNQPDMEYLPYKIDENMIFEGIQKIENIKY